MLSKNLSFLGLFIGLGLSGSLSSCTKCSNNANTASKEAAPATDAKPAESAPVSATELGIVDTVVGTGTEATDGKKITVHYTGTLPTGVKFDSSLDRNSPFSFTLGEGQVIQGWEQGFKGMKIGGKRKLTVPPTMGYGEQGVNGVIPPNSTLLFEVELLNVE